MNWFRAVLIAFDQFINALLGGWPDETLSSRAWRWHTNGVRSWPKNTIDTLFYAFDGAEHCKQSFVSERERRHLPPEAR